MMHGKSVSHVDVSIRFHHVIRWCFVTRDICSFPGRASVVLRVRGLLIISYEHIIINKYLFDCARMHALILLMCMLHTILAS